MEGNPKSETRNPKEISNQKVQIQNLVLFYFGFLILGFFRFSGFEFRIFLRGD